MALDDEKEKEAVKDTPFSGAVLHGMIISIASQRYNGSYLEGYPTPCCIAFIYNSNARVTECNYTDVPKTIWCKFLVHKLDGNTVAFESMRYRNHYLVIMGPMGPHCWCCDKAIELTHSPNPPANNEWGQWKIIGNDANNVMIESVQYPKHYLDVYHNGFGRFAAVTKCDSVPHNKLELKWSIKVGAPDTGMKDGWEVVDSVENKTSKEVVFKLTYKVGITSQKGWSQEDVTTVALEAAKNFGAGNFASASIKAKVEYSHKWSSSSSETWSKSKEIAFDLPVLPGKRVTVLQLTAYYGGCKIGSNNYKIEEHEL